jgi:hypothetical protein
MKTRTYAFAGGLALLVHGIFFTTVSAAEQHCSTNTTIGRYVVVCDGYLTPAPNSPLVPAKELATVTADAEFTFKSTDGILTLGGAVLHGEATGTGVLRPNCTGTITYSQTINGRAAPDIHFSFVISKGGDVIDGISIDPGAVYSCHLTRITSE